MAWLLRKRIRLRVSGASMEPTLSSGDVVFVDRASYTNQRPADGDIVVAKHPQQPEIEIIKRVRFTDGSGVYLVSDNTAEINAADSRRFGMVPFDLIIGQVTATAPASR